MVKYQIYKILGGGIVKLISSMDSLHEFIGLNRICVLYFSDELCSVCIDLLPKVERLISSYPAIQLANVDISSPSEISGQLSVFTAPTVILFIDGKEILRESRFISIDSLKIKIDRILDFMS